MATWAPCDGSWSFRPTARCEPAASWPRSSARVTPQRRARRRSGSSYQTSRRYIRPVASSLLDAQYIERQPADHDSLPIQMGSRDRQYSLPFPSRRGGRRPPAGRKRAPGRRPCVPHRTPPSHVPRYPAHVTLRASIRCLRSPRVFLEARRAIGAASYAKFRICSLLGPERSRTPDRRGRGSRGAVTRRVGLAICLTRAVNGVLNRQRSIWDDRYPGLRGFAA